MVFLPINSVDCEKSKKGFYHPRSIPGDLRFKDFIYTYAGFMGIPVKEKRAIVKRAGIKPATTFARLTPEQRFAAVMSLLGIGEVRIYLIHDMAADLPVECAIQLKKRMEELREQDYLAVYLSSTKRPDSKPVEMDHYFYEGSLWIYMVEENITRIKVLEK